VPNLATPRIPDWNPNTKGTLHGHVDDAGKGVLWTKIFPEVEFGERFAAEL
jgi:hypothetical protein